MRVLSKGFDRRSSGFTLIEVLMAMSILGLVTVGTFDVLRSGMLRVTRWADDSNAQGDLNVAMALFARDIRSAYVMSDDENTYFAGSPATGSMINHVDFTRRALGPTIGQDPIWEIGYFLEPSKSIGTWNLCRRCGGSVRPSLAGVRSIKLEYFDGNRWSAEWNWDHERQQPMKGIRGLPLFVRLTLEMQADGNADGRQWIVPVMSSVINRACHA